MRAAAALAASDGRRPAAGWIRVQHGRPLGGLPQAESIRVRDALHQSMFTLPTSAARRPNAAVRRCGTEGGDFQRAERSANFGPVAGCGFEAFACSEEERRYQAVCAARIAGTPSG